MFPLLLLSASDKITDPLSNIIYKKQCQSYVYKGFCNIFIMRKSFCYRKITIHARLDVIHPKSYGTHVGNITASQFTGYATIKHKEKVSIVL